MAGQDGRRAGGDPRDEGQEVVRAELRGGSADHGRDVVRVPLRGAVAREVLEDGHDAGLLQAARHRGGERADERRVRPERPRAERRCRLRIEEVADGGEHERRAHRRRLVADCAADAPRESRRAGRPEREVAGPGGGTVADGLELAAFLVEPDHERWGRRGAGGLEPGGQLAHLGRRADIARPEQRHPGRPSLPDRGQDARRRFRALERPQEPDPGQVERPLAPERRIGPALGPRRHPFTDPAVRPPTMRRWTMRKKTRTGSVKRVDAAIVAPQSVPKLVRNEPSQTGSV